MEYQAEKRLKRPRMAPADFMKEIQSALAQRQEKRLALLCLTLNRTDRVSALAQDPAAAQVLKEVSSRIESMLRPVDYFTFVSYDEVWLLLPDLASESVSTLACNGLRDVLRSPIIIQKPTGGSRTVKFSPTIGVVLAPKAQIDVEEMLYHLDEASAMARRKEERAFVVRVSEDGVLGKRSQLESELRQALFANELDVFLQPQIDLHTNRCVSAEALIRWTRNNGRAVNPALIASICEEAGMMDQLTRFVMNNVMRTQMALKAQEIDIAVGINITASTLTDQHFPEIVQQAAGTWGVDPSRLVFELTEGSIVENEKLALDFMKRLCDLGCEMSIDDFGTGYSSFAYLRQFPLSELKIDKSFVMNLGKDASDRQIVQVLVDLCQVFELRSVAEGVETPEAAVLLTDLGCHVGQGYLYSRAMPTTDFADWFTRFHQKANIAVPA